MEWHFDKTKVGDSNWELTGSYEREIGGGYMFSPTAQPCGWPELQE
jgi:hypothetical protein